MLVSQKKKYANWSSTRVFEKIHQYWRCLCLISLSGAWAGWLLSSSSSNDVVVLSMCDWKLGVKPVERIGGPVRSLTRGVVVPETAYRRMPKAVSIGISPESVHWKPGLLRSG
jgi:hypothetical protein